MLQNKHPLGKKSTLFLLTGPCLLGWTPAWGRLLLWEGWGYCTEAADTAACVAPTPPDQPPSLVCGTW